MIKSIWLTDKVVAGLPLPERGTLRIYDAADPRGREGWTSGFGVRVAAGGGKSFVLRYRSRKDRAERLFTIGSWPTWSVTAARAEARELKRRIDQGQDPQTERQAERGAPTVSQLADRFVAEHLPSLRPNTRKSYLHAIERQIRPALGRKLVSVVDHRDIEDMHRAITKRGAPLLANRVVQIASKLFTFAIRERMRADNPVRGCPRNPETSRTRYLTSAELGRLQQALAEYPDQSVVNALTIMMLTGCRKTEALSATWGSFDLENRGVWRKEAHSTKQKRVHETPLSDPALALLRSMRKDAPEAVYLFPGRLGRPHLSDIQKSWEIICGRAGIVGLRIHDLRHSYASMLVSNGASLPLIGQMLGHTLVQTTARYSHLFDDVQREAANKVGGQLAGLVAKRPKGGKLKVVS